MAQADGVVANGTGSAVRSDINNQYAALWSNHSGSTEPSSGKVAFQTWADTNSGYLKIRNAANNAWIQLFKLDGTDICRLTGSTNNQITTVTGANAIQGEANLTCDGTNLTIGSGSSSVDHSLNLSADTGTFALKHNRGSHKLELSDSDGTGIILEIDTLGNVKITDGDLQIGTAGHGIDFSATSDATGMTSELLDEYEEGSHTATITIGAGTITTTHSNTLTYTKIGRVVHVLGRLYHTFSQSNVTTWQTSLPFASISGGNAVESGSVVGVFRADAVSGEAPDGMRRIRVESGNSYANMVFNTTSSGGDFGHTNPHIIFNLTYYAA